MGIADRDYMKRRKPDSRGIPPVAVLVVLLLVFAFCLFLNQGSPLPDKQLQEDFEDTTVRVEQTIPQELGSFKVESGTILVSDPDNNLVSAEKDGIISRFACLNGNWTAVSTIKVFSRINQRVSAELLAFHQSIKSPANLIWKLESSDIGVDDGQAGFFDLRHFKDASIVPMNIIWKNGGKPVDPSDLWYSYCCEMTRHQESGGVIPHGVVVNSGYGDGAFTLYSSRDAYGKVVALKLIFVNDQGEG